ncbi:disease resistance protein L6-like [Rhodamnia argentea]|uniref:Disease resistance protein L6-like n=1 Tax=Rhodamnia argentea TaxID=178133 RepID=A0ABM3HBU7_9MYRT|nr:disease resistance protein L6-like [Rhodamnia argentea]
MHFFFLSARNFVANSSLTVTFFFFWSDNDGDFIALFLLAYSHGKLTRLVARQVLLKLKVSPVHLSDPLVGIHQSVNEVIDLLSVEAKDIRLIGLCGIGGIGKTTLAKVVYHKLSADFESCSFIPDIRQASESSSSGLLNLQRQLIRDILGDKRIEISSIDQGKNMIKARFCRKRVLVFLDDVNDRRQLTALAEKREWFGSGSRIVVTTRDKSVLSVFEDSLAYEVGELNNLDSLQLFSKYAFRRNSPPIQFLCLSEKVTAKAGGLPLTIELIGSFLCGKEKAVWEDTIKKMEKHLHKDVETKLMLSYEALDGTQKQIFLDIACFLAGENKRDATYMWDDCELFPDEGIEVLLLMSLVKIGAKNELWMHDQLKDLGRSIVRGENRNDPGKRSRVWNHKEALDVIAKKKGTESTEAICVDLSGALLTPEEFKKVPNVRFLGMTSGNLSGDFEDLFPEVRWLSWKNCPSNLQATNFCPKNLLILDLSGTEITESWNGWTQLEVATRLKVLNLSNCRRLRITPDLSAYLSLEILILEDCRSLVLIHRSIGHLRRLKHLNLKRCYRLQVLPVELGSLETLTELLIDQNISGVRYDTIINKTS